MTVEIEYIFTIFKKEHLTSNHCSTSRDDWIHDSVSVDFTGFFSLLILELVNIFC